MKLTILIILLFTAPVLAQEARNPVIPYVPYTEPERKPSIHGMTAEQEAQLKATVDKFLAETDQKISEAIKRDNPNGIPQRDWTSDLPSHRFWRAYYQNYSPSQSVRYAPRYVPRYYPFVYHPRFIHPLHGRVKYWH